MIYGENGSGKSGYARVLKKAVRCTEKAVETIFSNVFNTTTARGPAKALFELNTGSGPFDVKWFDGHSIIDDLKRFAVFDSKCARYYLASSNQLSFAPAIFDSLRLLDELTSEIKQRFLGSATESDPSSPPAYQFIIDPTTTVGKTLLAISNSTDPKTISLLAKWAEENRHSESIMGRHSAFRCESFSTSQGIGIEFGD